MKDKPNDRRGGPPQTFEAVGMQLLLDTVRATGAKNLVDRRWTRLGLRLLRHPGRDGSFKILDGNGVIYANHAYNNKGHSVETWIKRMERRPPNCP